jgi:hypothetical protein
MSRFITRELAGELGVPPAFAWESLIETLRGSAGEEKAMESFCHSSADCLVNHFDRLFGTSKFSFDLKPDNKHHRVAHKEILEAMNDVNMMEVDFAVDILGWVYEQHLKTGSSTASRDLGQYFTDRGLCNYMVRLCRPGFKHPGVPESICDPTMGTAGFLTAAIKYYKRAYPDTPVDWRAQLKQIHGCDTDDRVAGVARLNIFMETHGCRPEYLLTHNSLFDDLPQHKYNIILANMPFGLKGLKFKDCCERVKSLKLDGTKSEPLFLQLMMVSLAPGGRCAVVVPDGLLVNSSKCHNETRKYLLDNFELKKVIKMEGSFFMNTSIKPSVLFFENTGKPTTEVEFWKVTKKDDSDLDDEEELLVSVPREKFGEDCSLDMRRYLDAEKPAANPAGFPMVKLGDILTDHPVKKPVATTNADGGVFSLFSSSCDVFKHSVAEFTGRPYLLQGSRGTISKATHYCDTPFSASNNVFVLSATDPSSVSLKFIYYYLRLNNVADHTATTSVIPMLTKTMFRDIKMPLPPLPIQDEIVATLDRIYNPGTTELADTIKMTDRAMDLVLASPSGETLAPIVEAQRLIRKSAQMVADVKAQMVAIVKASSSTSTLLSLKDVCSVAFGERITQKDHKGTLYPVYGGGESNFHTDRFNREGMTCKVARFAVSEKSMVLMINQKYWLMDSGFTISSKEKTKVVDEYLWWVLWANQARLTACSTGSCQKNISMDMFYTLEFGFPSVEVQTSVVSKIRMLQSQLTALESLQKQSEDNARFILESYLGAPVTEEATAHAPLAAVGGAGTGSVSEEDDTTEGDSTDHSVISHA